MRKADSSNRLKEALNSRIQPHHDAKYSPGDTIIYLNKDNKWDGPAEVITMESKTIHILQNGTIRKVSMCKARHWNEASQDDSENDDEADMVTVYRTGN